MKELNFFLGTELILRTLLKFDTIDRIQFKMEIAKVYNWFEKIRKEVDTKEVE